MAGRWDVAGAQGMLALQRLAGNQGVTAALDDSAAPDEEPSPVHDVIGSGGGQPLDSAVRADMEARLGHDFGDVRVHHDARAEESARSVNAHAYTVGSDIVFQRDRYDPSSEAGRITLAHELTHVIQQRSGPVDGTAAPGGIRLSDPSDRFEREAAANAQWAVSGLPELPRMTGNATNSPWNGSPYCLPVARQVTHSGQRDDDGSCAYQADAQPGEPGPGFIDQVFDRVAADSHFGPA